MIVVSKMVTAKHPDVVVMKDGDRFTCTVKKLDADLRMNKGQMSTVCGVESREVFFTA